MIFGYYTEPKSEGQLYWPIKLQNGGSILCPGDGMDYTQYVDVRDAAKWLLQVAEKSLMGPYNIGKRISFTEYLYGLKALSDKPSTFHWASVEFLEKQGIRPFSDMPMWVPRTKGPGFLNIRDEKARAQGFNYRPLTETFSEVIKGFYAHYPHNYEFGLAGISGITRQKEQELLKLLNN